jgi:glycerophosphoryl diester phosphodiesterase
MVKIIGHRGASDDAPENTISSIKEAFVQGADGVEVDIRLTKDKKSCLHT